MPKIKPHSSPTRRRDVGAVVGSGGWHLTGEGFAEGRFLGLVGGTSWAFRLEEAESGGKVQKLGGGDMGVGTE